MYCRSHCFLFRLESSGYTILCSHTRLQGLGICTISWHMHWTGSPPLEQSVLLWLLFLSFLNRYGSDIRTFGCFCYLRREHCPLELPSQRLFVGCWCNLSLGVVWLGFCRLSAVRKAIVGDIARVLCAIFPFIGLVYEGHQSRCYSFHGLVMTPVVPPALQGVVAAIQDVKQCACCYGDKADRSLGWFCPMVLDLQEMAFGHVQYWSGMTAARVSIHTAASSMMYRLAWQIPILATVLAWRSHTGKQVYHLHLHLWLDWLYFACVAEASYPWWASESVWNRDLLYLSVPAHLVKD